MSYHGTNFAKGEVVIFGGAESADVEPLADVISDPEVSFFDVTAVSHTRPVFFAVSLLLLLRVGPNHHSLPARAFLESEDPQRVDYEALVSSSCSRPPNYVAHGPLGQETGLRVNRNRS